MGGLPDCRVRGVRRLLPLRPREALARSIHPEIRDLDGAEYQGVDLLTGGFPCQPFSLAGLRRGKADDRFLWPQMLRVVAQSRPAWVVAENVPGIVSLALDDVLASLKAEGYAARTLMVPACGVGALHRRERVFVVATDVASPNAGVALVAGEGASGGIRPLRQTEAELSRLDDLIHEPGAHGQVWDVARRSEGT